MEKAPTRETSICSLPKSSSLNMLFLLLLQLLAITTLPCSANNATQLVYDTEGNVLNSKQNYYILPAKRASGGGSEPCLLAYGVCTSCSRSATRLSSAPPCDSRHYQNTLQPASRFACRATSGSSSMILIVFALKG